MKQPHYKSKKDLVVEVIREAILSAEYKPGDRLLQDELARSLDVSPTPVREALRELEAEGVLKHSPNKGVRVAETNVENVREIYLIRAALESLATRQAVPLMTDSQIDHLKRLQAQIEARIEDAQLEELRKLNHDLHMQIYKASGLHELLRLIQGFWMRFPWDTLHVIPGRASRSGKEHRRLLQAIEAREAELAGSLMQRHIENGAEALRSYLAEEEARE